MLVEPILPPAEHEKLAVRPPPTQAELARASEDAFRISWSLDTVDIEATAYLEFLLARDLVLRGFCRCECAFAEEVVGCVRRLRLSRLRHRPQARARRRQRCSAGGCERAPPGDDGDGDDPPGRPSRPSHD